MGAVLYIMSKLLEQYKLWTRERKLKMFTK